MAVAVGAEIGASEGLGVGVAVGVSVRTALVAGVAPSLEVVSQPLTRSKIAPAKRKTRQLFMEVSGLLRRTVSGQQAGG